MGYSTGPMLRVRGVPVLEGEPAIELEAVEDADLLLFDFDS